MRLKITNYGILDDVDLVLEPGLTSLVGPNGSGKSTIVDALFFALTGETIDGRNVADRVNWEAFDGKAVVRLEAEDYAIERTIKSAGVTHKLTLKDGEVLTKKGDINSRLFQLFGIENSSILKDVFFSAQLRATDLFDATDANRLALLSRVFGFDKLEQCRAAIYKVLAETPVPTVNAETIAAFKERLSATDTKLSELRQQSQDLEKSISELPADADECRKQLSRTLDSVRSVHEDNLQKAQAKIDELTEPLDTATKLMTKLQHLHTYARCKVTRADVEDKKSQCEERLQTLTDGPSVEALSTALNGISAQRAKMEIERADLLKRLNLDTGVCPLTGGKPCIDLLRAHDPELIKQQLDELGKQFETLDTDEAQLKQFLSARIEADKEAEKLRIELQQAERTLEEDCEMPEGADKLSMDELKALAEDTERVSLAQAEVDRLKFDLGVAQQTKERSEVWLSEHANDQMISAEEYSMWTQRLEQCNTLDAQLKSAKVQLSNMQDYRNDNEKSLQQLLDDKDKAEAFQHRAEILRSVRELLSKGQLQRLLLQNTLKKLNKEIATCSKIFEFPYGIYIEDSGAIRYRTDMRDGIDVRYLSGGQKYVAAIITRLAFGRVLGASFPFVVLDEPSTCLDEQSRELLAGLLSVLNDRAKTEGTYLVVPTHDHLLTAVSNKVFNL